MKVLGLSHSSGLFRVVIWRPATGGNRGDNRGDNPVPVLPYEQRRICEMLRENPKGGIRTVATTLGIRPRTVEKQIAALKAKGIVIREGGTRGYWKIKVV